MGLSISFSKASGRRGSALSRLAASLAVLLALALGAAATTRRPARPRRLSPPRRRKTPTS